MSANTELTSNERATIELLREKLCKMSALLVEEGIPQGYDANAWYLFLSRLREISGNTSTDASFISCLLAKQYLAARFNVDLDVAGKSQSANGFDIDIFDSANRRIVAEIKTTVPLRKKDRFFGSQQYESIKKDFAKLHSVACAKKFFFVTDRAAFDALKSHSHKFKPDSVTIVLLPEGEDFQAQTTE